MKRYERPSRRSRLDDLEPRTSQGDVRGGRLALVGSKLRVTGSRGLVLDDTSGAEKATTALCVREKFEFTP